jgi:release factor glutamine methyltransferase
MTTIAWGVALMAAIVFLAIWKIARRRKTTASFKSGARPVAVCDAQQRIITNVEEFLRLSLQHKDEYEVTVFGHSMIVHPQVMSPKYSYSPQFVIRHWDVGAGMSVVDVGTGSGILALFAALNGARKVVALDINKIAVETAKKNMQLNGVSDRVDVRVSDLFAALGDEKFDRVVFNAPYFNRPADPTVPLTYGVFDEGYQASKRFLNEAPKYLAPGGKILLGFSTLDDVSLMKRWIDEAGLYIETESMETKGHTRVLYALVPKQSA